MPEQLHQIPIDQLMPDPGQPRKSFLAEEIERLAASIAARGVLCPLRVHWDEERKTWRIIVGESRSRAARLAGLKTVPCLPVEGEPSETDILSDQIIENSVRNALRPLESARALAKLKALKRCNSRQLAAELGIGGAAITRAEALLGLPDDVQALVDSGKVGESAAYEISRLPDERSRRELAQEVAAGRLNRDQAAAAVRGRLGRKRKHGSRKPGRLSAKVDDIGVSVTVTATGRSVTVDDVRKAIDQLKRVEKKLSESSAASPAGPLPAS